jgi:RNA polymerase sigma-54 factor
VITSLRRAGWPGLCAGSLAESLSLQAYATGAAPPPEVRALLTAGLDTLVTPGATVPAESGRALSWLRAHIAAEVFDDAAPPPRSPVDLVVRRAGATVRAEVVAGPWSAARVATSYRAAAGEPGVDAAVHRADRFLTAVERREATVQRVGDVVAVRQAGRMTGDRAAQRPLTRREVAQELGLHESTVSRVVAGKSVGLPTGETVALASLFGPGHDVHDCLREVIGAERIPLSDSALASALGRRGHRVARRTVAKYRAELGIPDAGRRAVADAPRAAVR